MKKKAIVLLGSPRKNGNTSLLADAFIRGAAEAGNQTEKILLGDKNISGCLGCGACRRNGGQCVQKDAMQEIYPKLLEADVIVFASPVYFYSWTSLMKKVIDRTFAIEKALSHKKFYLISAGAAPEEQYMQTMLASFRQYISCFRGEGNAEGGHVIGYGTNRPGDAKNSTAMSQAYEMGRNI